MKQVSAQVDNQLQSLSDRYAVSIGAVKALLEAVSAGGGRMAQFQHPELGGSGQWMRGGMTMIGQMGNYGLQNTVSSLCADLAALLEREPGISNDAQFGGGSMSSTRWWPPELGSPSSSGGQNDALYAYFPDARRLAISRQGQITVYDTLDHQIGGVQQQQGGSSSSLEFTSQRGTFTVDSLPAVPFGNG